MKVLIVGEPKYTLGCAIRDVIDKSLDISVRSVEICKNSEKDVNLVTLRSEYLNEIQESMNKQSELLQQTAADLLKLDAELKQKFEPKKKHSPKGHERKYKYHP